MATLRDLWGLILANFRGNAAVDDFLLKNSSDQPVTGHVATAEELIG